MPDLRSRDHVFQSCSDQVPAGFVLGIVPGSCLCCARTEPTCLPLTSWDSQSVDLVALSLFQCSSLPIIITLLHFFYYLLINMIIFSLMRQIYLMFI